MKNYSIKFPRINDNQHFSQFALDLGGQIQADNVIQLTGKIARGTVKKLQFEGDFSIGAWDMVFYCPVDLSKEINPEELSNTYSIIYILTPESIAIKNIDQHTQYNKLQNKSAVLLSDNVYIDFELQSNQPIRFLYFNVTASWLQQNLQPLGISMDDISNDDTGLAPLIVIEPCTTSQGQAACRLFNNIIQATDDGTAGLQAPAQLLITELLEKMTNKTSGKTNTGRNIYYGKVAEAEEILRAHLQNNLPTLEKIAKQVALSESTLKRHFKAVYGKNIYQYYLEQKMNLAKSLLLERPLTVNETAEILGYEKVSNFIDIFKKHHGFSPGRMKKSMEFMKVQ